MTQAKTKFIQAKDLYFLSAIVLLQTVGWVGAPRLRNCVVRSIALTAYQLSRDKRRLAEENLANTFGETLDARRRREIVKGAFREFWMDLFSLSLSREEREALQGVEVIGVERRRTR